MTLSVLIRKWSGFGKNIANWIGRSMAYPSNVLHFATETGNKNHSATFPSALPEWFIKLFTQEDHWVLDPFVGSGTTCEAAMLLSRNSVGIDMVSDYVKFAKARLKLNGLGSRKSVDEQDNSKRIKQIH